MPRLHVVFNMSTIRWDWLVVIATDRQCWQGNSALIMQIIIELKYQFADILMVSWRNASVQLNSHVFMGNSTIFKWIIKYIYKYKI